MDDFEKITLDEIMELVEESYQDTRWSFVSATSKTFKYKDSFVKISVSDDEDDL